MASIIESHIHQAKRPKINSAIGGISAYLLILVALTIAIILKSRAFIIGYTVSLFFIYFACRQFQVKWKKLQITLVTLFLLTLVLAMWFKRDSSLGRLLIYKVSVRMLKDNFPGGTGLGAFGKQYGNYQADYFSKELYTEKEVLLADDTKHAFNDYLQFIVETGYKGALFLLVVTGIIIWVVFQALKKNVKNPSLLIISAGQIIAIALAALFTHVFESIFFQCLFVSSFLIVAYYALGTGRLYWHVAIWVLALCSIAYLHYELLIRNYPYYKQYEHAQELHQAGFIQKSLSYYKRLYPHLREDAGFLYSYATALMALEHTYEAEAMLEKILSKDNSYMFLQQLADCYYKNGKLKKAEQAYLKSVYMVPNRFNTRYKLFNFYIESRQFIKAMETGKALLNLTVKIPSTQVNNIKEDVSTTLKKYKLAT